MFVSAGIDLKFHNYPADTTHELLYKQLGTGEITAVSWSKDNTFLTFVSEKGNPEIISLKDPCNIKNVHTITAVADISTIAFQKTTKRCIGLVTHTGQIALYDTKNKLISKLFQSAPSSVNLLDFNSSDKQMAVSCTNGSVLLYDLKHGGVCRTLGVNNACTPTAMCYHPEEKGNLVIGASDGTIIKWDTIANTAKYFPQIHSAPISDLAITRNSNLLITVGHDNKFCIHDDKQECIFRSHQAHALTAVDVSNDGLTIAIGSESGNINIYDIRQLMQPRIISKSHNSKINKIVFENKMKYDFNEGADPAMQKSQEILAKVEKVDRACDSKLIEKAAVDKELQTEKAASDKRNQSENITMKVIKHEVADSIHRGANELQTHLMTQFGGLHSFIANEFHTMNNQLEEKWDFLGMAKDT